MRLELVGAGISYKIYGGGSISRVRVIPPREREYYFSLRLPTTPPYGSHLMFKRGHFSDHKCIKGKKRNGAEAFNCF